MSGGARNTQLVDIPVTVDFTARITFIFLKKYFSKKMTFGEVGFLPNSKNFPENPATKRKFIFP